MSRRHRSRSAGAPPAARLYEDDGMAPSSKSVRVSHRVVDRRTRQLCGQVLRALASLLMGECHDDVLRDVVVDGVTPAPDASRLRVILRAADPATVTQHLDRVRAFLRREVANAVQRKRAPELVYLVLPTGEVSP